MDCAVAIVLALTFAFASWVTLSWDYDADREHMRREIGGAL